MSDATDLIEMGYDMENIVDHFSDMHGRCMKCLHRDGNTCFFFGESKDISDDGCNTYYEPKRRTNGI